MSITYYESEKEYYDIDISDDRILSMTTESDKKWIDYFGREIASELQKIEVTLPTDSFCVYT